MTTTPLFAPLDPTAVRAADPPAPRRAVVAPRLLPVGQHQAVALLVAAGGAVLLVGIELGRLWDLDKAAHLAFAGVVMLALGVGLAVVAFVKAGDGSSSRTFRISGEVADQVRWVLQHRPLTSTGIVELDAALGVAGDAKGAPVTASELHRARRLLTERLERHLRAADAGEGGEDGAAAERDAISSLLHLRTTWDEAEEAKHRSRTVGVLVGLVWRGARVGTAALLALLGVLLLLTAAQKDSAAEAADSATQHAAVVELDKAAAIDERKQILALEADSEVQRRKRLLVVEGASATASRKDLALPIEKRMTLHLHLSGADLQRLNKSRAACGQIKAGHEVTAIAIGGTWERPLLDFPPDRHKGCGPLVFHPKDAVDARP